MLIIKDWKSTNIELEKILKNSKYTILYFYPKDNTPWCTMEAHDFTRLENEFNKLEIQIIWVSKDDEKSHQKFIEGTCITFPLISDEELTLHKQFWTWWEKNNYGKISLWTIRSTFLLDSKWEIIKKWINVKATWHVEKILKEIKETLK